ncbi:MAG: SH3 domain-containing protein [Ruminococcaceae bacterium]|nr:SH3 domain-containing protein [Oscillospiraceae bacterium]
MHIFYPIINIPQITGFVKTAVKIVLIYFSQLYVINCNEFVTLRTTPSTSSAEIMKIPLGKNVEFFSDAGNDFYKVSYNGYIGYALAAYLQ